MSTGAQWRAHVKAELAKRAKARRQRRGRRMRDADYVTVAIAGMLRKTVSTGEKDGTDGGHPHDQPGPPPAAA